MLEERKEYSVMNSYVYYYSSLLCIFDNEEIGSSGPAGAASNGLMACLERLTPQDLLPVAIRKSFVVSAV